MSNLAQTVNVLQALILTEKEKMILTPTYYVYALYKVHQNATLIPQKLSCVSYVHKKDKIPALSASASLDKEGHIHISLCNFDPHNNHTLTCELRGAEADKISGQILTADKINSHNTFENNDVVKPVDFKDIRKEKGKIIVNLPSKSVVVLKISKS